MQNVNLVIETYSKVEGQCGLLKLDCLNSVIWLRNPDRQAMMPSLSSASRSEDLIQTLSAAQSSLRFM